MTLLVGEEGQILRTTTGQDLVSGGPFQKTLGGLNAIAESSVPFSAWGAAAMTLLGGKTISYVQLYRTQPYVAAAVDVLTEQVSRLPLKVYKRGKDGERERVYSHRLVDLIRRPAPRCGPTQLKQWLMQPALLHGNSLLAKGREEKAGPPTSLLPLDWRFMAAKREREGLWIERWESNEFGGRLFFDPEDLLHVRWEPPDGRIGVSPLQQLGVTLKVEDAAQRYQQSYLDKGAAPPNVLSLPKDVFADEEAKGKIRANLQGLHVGPDNAGNTVFLPDSASLDALGHNAHEAALIEQRKLTREEVAAVYKVPQPLVGILDHATYSNVAELHRMFFTTVLGPWLTLIEESFQAQVIDPEPAFEGLFVEFDLAEVLKGDKLKEITALKTAVQTGLLTLNEARAVLNMPAFEADWCSEPLIPANNLRSAPEPDDAAGLEEFAQQLGFTTFGELLERQVEDAVSSRNGH